MLKEQFPPFLGKHRLTDTFNLDDKNFLLRNRLAYFHDSEFPLYMHSHDFYELNIIVEGYGRHYIEDKNFPAVPGDVFVIPPKINHGYWAQNDTMSIFHLLLDSKLFDKYSKEIKCFPGFYLLFETEPQIRKNIASVAFFLKLDEAELDGLRPDMARLVKLAKADFTGREILFEMYAMGLIFELSRLIDRDFQPENAKKQNDLRPLINTTNFMLQNISQTFTLEDLAKMAALSRTGYIEHFKQLFGMTPFAYLKKIRIDHAVKLLRTTDHSVAFIAQSCGFSDSSHLIRTFKETVGMTPIQFKKANPRAGD